MGLRQFLEPVQTRLGVVLDALGVTKPEFDLGWKSTLMQHGAIPRIVWVPRGGPTKGDAIGGNDVSTPRRLAARHVAIDAHIWCEGIDECEAMANHLIGAFQDAAWGSYSVAGEQWDTGEDAEFTKDGQLFVVTFDVRIPWTRELHKATLGAVTLQVTASDPMAGS